MTAAQINLMLPLFALFVIPAIFFLITQQNILKTIHPLNRAMSPGQVWLPLIPIFNWVWQFIVVSRIAESIQRELSFETRFSFESEVSSMVNRYEKPTYNIGVAYCVLYCCSIIPLLGGLAALAAIVCWIIYWAKLAEYKRRIEQMKYLKPHDVAI